MFPNSRSDSILLIGPPRTGKTTLSRALATRLGWPHHEYDAVRRAYFEEIGFDMAFNLALFESQGAGAMLQYWRCFAPHALERFFDEHAGVLDLGGGSPLVDHPQQVARVVKAFAPFAHVVLLLPDPDLERSCQVLGSRTEDSEERAFQRYAIGHGMLQQLATYELYANGRCPESLADQVAGLLDG